MEARRVRDEIRRDRWVMSLEKGEIIFGGR